MFLIKIFHFLKGYVILSLWGKNRDKFLDAMVKRGVRPEYVKISGERTLIKISVRDFFTLRGVCPKSRMHIEKKCGGAFFAKRLRKSFVIFGGVTLIMLVLGTQFIWDIRIEGAEECDKERLAEAISAAGLYPGMPKARLLGGYEMKNIILNHTEDICWAWVYVNGARAVVEVRKSIMPPEVFDKNVPCDIIAARSGILKSVTAKNGLAVLSENCAVAPGDVIISGRMDGYEVHASGSVEAYTEHKRVGEYKQYYCYKKYTGKRRRFLTLKLFGARIPLFAGEKIPFENYDKKVSELDFSPGGRYFGLGLSVTSAEEYSIQKEPISRELTEELAKRELSEKISAELLRGAEKLSEETLVEEIDADTVRVTVIMNFLEQIGTEKRTEEVDFVEPKTD